MNKKFTFNASFRLGDDHLDGVDRGVVDLDVVLLEREVSRDDLLASEGFEFLARSHVRLGNRALNDVVLADVTQAIHLHKFHSGNTLGLDEVPEGIVIGGEDRDRAFLREDVFLAGGGDGGTHHGVRRGLADHTEGIVVEGSAPFFTTFAVGHLRRDDGGSLLLLGDNFGDDLGAGDLGL